MDNLKKPSSGVRIRLATPEDEPNLTGLFHRVFGREVTAQQWRWKLDTAGRFPTSWVAETRAGIVGHYGGTPRPVACNGLRGWAMVAVHAMVHPDFRRRGILTELVGAAHQAWRAEGIVFVMALLNEQWGSLRQSLGWRLGGTLAWKVRVLDPGAVLARRLKLPLAGVLSPLSRIWFRKGLRALSREPELQTGIMENPSDELKPFFANYRESEVNSVIRDGSWVRHRYLDAPHRDYRFWGVLRESSPLGYAVTRLDRQPGRVLAIIAELVAGPDAGERLLAETLAAVRGQGADLSACLAMPGTALDRLLEKAGFRNRWGAFDLWVMDLSSGWPLPGPEGTREWQLQGGDFDVV